MNALPPNGHPVSQRTIDEVRRLEDAEREDGRRLEAEADAAQRAEQLADLAKRALEAIDEGPVRLFISFAYRREDEDGDVIGAPLFGNTIVDSACEPFEPEHITSLQYMIERHAGRASVIILHWQRIA